MERSQAWYLHERAEQMAVMVFTRVPGIVIRRAPDDLGIDLVAILAGVLGGMFGIELKASLSVSTIITKSGKVQQSMAKTLSDKIANFPFPVGLFACGMQDDSTYFGWILAPELRDGASGRTLSAPSPIVVEPATREVISRTFEQVLNWYNAPATQQVVAASPQPFSTPR